MESLKNDVIEVVRKINSEYNYVKFSVYRAAMKLAKLQELLRLHDINIAFAVSSFRSKKAGNEEVNHASGIMFKEMQRLLQNVLKMSGFDDINKTKKLSSVICVLMFEIFRSNGNRKLPALSVMLFLTLLSAKDVKKKYQILFKLYAGSSGVLTRNGLKSMLGDVASVLELFGETLGSVSSALRTCFHGVLGSRVSEQQFLAWALQDVEIFMWLPTMHRLNFAKSSIHHSVECAVCKIQPIIGMRFQCLKCLNYNTCQVCFLTQEVGAKSHRVNHPQQEYCSPAGKRDRLNSFARTLRNKLTKRYKRKSRKSSADSGDDVSSLDDVNVFGEDFCCDNDEGGDEQAAAVKQLVVTEKGQLQSLLRKVIGESDVVKETADSLEKAARDTAHDDDLVVLQSKLNTIEQHNRSLENELESLKCVVFADMFPSSSCSHQQEKELGESSSSCSDALSSSGAARANGHRLNDSTCGSSTLEQQQRLRNRQIIADDDFSPSCRGDDEASQTSLVENQPAKIVPAQRRYSGTDHSKYFQPILHDSRHGITSSEDRSSVKNNSLKHHHDTERPDVGTKSNDTLTSDDRIHCAVEDLMEAMEQTDILPPLSHQQFVKYIDKIGERLNLFIGIATDVLHES